MITPTRAVFRTLIALGLGLGAMMTSPVLAQDPPRIVIGSAVNEPMPIAVPTFIDEGGAGDFAREISRVVISDLEGLVTGAVSVAGDRITVKFRAYDVFNGTTLEGAALQFAGTTDGWRRMAHKVADVIYSKITGEGGYFDSRVVFVAESGPKNARLKRLAVMDYDGANVAYLTDSASIVLAPRFSPQGDRILYTSYETGFPRITLMDVASLRRQTLDEQQGTMTFAPRFSPDGGTVVFSLERGGNTDIYALSLGGGGLTQLTNAPSIETAPSFSPDGALWHSGLEPAWRLHRLHQAERRPLPHRGDADGRIGRAAPDGQLPGRGSDLGAERAGSDVHAGNQRGGRADEPVVGRHHRAEPEADPDRRPGQRPGLVAAFAMKCDAAPDSQRRTKLLVLRQSSQ